MKISKIYTFHPGDLKPPLNVYFSGYRTAEGFEGYFMMKRMNAPATALVGGAFTFNMLNNHQALAASETPITSEISSNSETVANQNSTTIKNSLKETVNSASLESNQSNSTKSKCLQKLQIQRNQVKKTTQCIF